MRNSNNQNPLFGNIEKKTGVKMNDILRLANSLSNANFKDEKTVRRVIQQVAQLAGKRVPKEKEDMIVKAILNNNMPTDLNSLTKMLK
ncbi:stage VI sporulation protein F [Calidifontibacillus erzurumensis]|uniref:Stage VI sporulation protein F n=1 Tax=Calidifontibacillus erzurumensis TaxID=2741433 RepID=A0A8J8KBC2_9BACI|nr:stage VI sporulation protein F [Calidifontibacillus erzurumensis]NSL50903.1 stage VI sporulation protein F [Calidifontibacillus erzurumensis]